MEYYSAIRRNEIELFVVRWMDLESVIQSEVSQKDKYCMILLICRIFKKKKPIPRNRIDWWLPNRGVEVAVKGVKRYKLPVVK